MKKYFLIFIDNENVTCYNAFIKQNTGKGERMVIESGLTGKIIDNAVGLPLESQKLLLMMAKSMKYTRDCIIQQSRNDMVEWPVQASGSVGCGKGTKVSS